MYIVSAHDLPWKSRRCWKEAIFLLLDVCKDLGAETGLVFCFQEWIQHSQVDRDTHEIEQFDEAVENSQRSNRENVDIPALNPLVEVNRKSSTDWLTVLAICRCHRKMNTKFVLPKFPQNKRNSEKESLQNQNERDVLVLSAFKVDLLLSPWVSLCIIGIPKLSLSRVVARFVSV